MNDTPSRATRWFAELRRRKVVRVALVYLAIAWLTIQVADATFGPIGLPDWVHRLVIVLVVLGFPLACGLAWAFDVTPRGLERTTSAGVERRAPASPEAPTPVRTGLLAAAPAAPGEPRQSAVRSSVAVLPFSDMSEAHDQEFFCDGIAEEIINALAGVRGLQVASRTSSFQFKGRAADVREIGRSLGVTAVLEGSVRRSGERARITAQLISTDDGFHLWSDTFDRRLEDAFATQSEIAQNVARALRSNLSKEEEANIERGGTRNPQAYEDYLRARQLLREFSDTTINQSIEMFRRAVAADPGFAQAHAGLAAAVASAVVWRSSSAPGLLELGVAAARRAAELAPDRAEVWVALGSLYRAQRRPEDAEQAFARALELNPRSFDVLVTYARNAFSAGDMQKAAELFERALQVNPDDYTLGSLLAGALRKLGETDRAYRTELAAIARLERRIELYPDDTRALHLAAGSYARLGRRDRALAVAGRALELRPDEFATLYNVACAYALLGEKDLAFAILERFGARGRGSFEWIREDPDFQSLHGDPRFERVVEQLSAAGQPPGAV